MQKKAYAEYLGARAQQCAKAARQQARDFGRQLKQLVAPQIEEDLIPSLVPLPRPNGRQFARRHAALMASADTEANRPPKHPDWDYD